MLRATRYPWQDGFRSESDNSCEVTPGPRPRRAASIARPPLSFNPSPFRSSARLALTGDPTLDAIQYSKTPCPYCGGPVPLVSGREVYPHRPDLHDKPIWACLPCKAWAGCHPGGTRRVGRLANAEDRALKVRAHDAFDPIWRSGRMKRAQAYKWLAGRLGIDPKDCHMGWMTNAQLEQAITICEEMT